MKTALAAAAILALSLILAAPVSAPAASPPTEGSEELSTLINRNLRSGGSWFTPAEQRVIERKCGYKPGEWDGFEANLSNGRFICRNGRVVADDPEVRAVLRAAEPRIEARVETVMARADVAAAIGRVAGTAAAEALRRVQERRGR
jgi:hypothetical protein